MRPRPYMPHIVYKTPREARDVQQSRTDLRSKRGERDACKMPEIVYKTPREARDVTAIKDRHRIMI